MEPTDMITAPIQLAAATVRNAPPISAAGFAAEVLTVFDMCYSSVAAKYEQVKQRFLVLPKLMVA